MKIPPYGKSIDHSHDPIFIWAGEKNRIHQSVRHFTKNTVAFYPSLNLDEYVWFVRDRPVAVIHFFEPGNFWIKTIILALLEHGAFQVSEISWPACGAWWNPHYDLYAQYFTNIGQTLDVVNYLRS